MIPLRTSAHVLGALRLARLPASRRSAAQALGRRGMAVGSPHEVSVQERMGSDGVRRYEQTFSSGRHVLSGTGCPPAVCDLL